MHPFRAYILRYQPLTDSEWERIEQCLQRRVYKKGELLLTSGKICKKLYFLESGFLRFFLDKDGERLTKFFTQAPYCFTSQRSFNLEIPGKDSIEALQEAVVWEISKADAYSLLALKNWNSFVRKLIQEVQFYTEELLEEAQNSTAEERYTRLLESNSPILQLAPLKAIASYLGIAPQSLSRIRKKYWSNKQKLT